MVNVNLLPEKNFLTPKERRRRRYLLLVVIFFTITSGALLGGSFAYRYYLKTRVQNLETDRANILAAVESQKDLALSLRTIKEKVLGVKAIKSSQIDLAGRIALVAGLLPPAGSISSLSISEDNSVTSGIVLANLSDLAPFLDKLTNQSGAVALSNIHLTNLNYVNGGISLNLSGVFKAQNHP